jgi:hypothetical protein
MRKSILPYDEFLNEKGKNPCWKGYRQIGTKKKNGRIVPNCVRIQENDDSGLTQGQKEWLDKCTKGTWSVNPENGLIDIIGSFRCTNQGLENFMGVSFGSVSGYFNCAFNRITSLEGAPRRVDGGFHCNSNNLTSLEGAPIYVGGDFNCAHNDLTSLEGSPIFMSKSDNFYCEGNKIKSLKGAPKKCRNFYFEENEVVSLEGFPVKCLDFNGKGNPLSNKIMARLGKTLINYGSSDLETFRKAVANQWTSIDMTEEDETLLAKYNPNLSQDEIRGYEALGKFREKII